MNMKKGFYSVLGILLVVAGAVLLLNSFSGLTGFVVLEDVNKNVSGVLGIVLVLGGIGVLMARAHHNRFYSEIAARIYDGLGTRNAYGHKTEQISVTESRIAAHGPFRKGDVENVISKEIESGRLVLDKSRQAVSISTNPERIEEIVDNYGGMMKDTVVDRLKELEERRLPAGVR